MEQEEGAEVYLHLSAPFVMIRMRPFSPSGAVFDT